MISLVNVIKSFEGVNALDGVTLTVPKGKLQGIVGPGGCGKSTLCKVVCGLLKPDLGVVFAAGADMAKSDDKKKGEIQARIGMQFQNDALFEHMTVLENIEYPLERLTKLETREMRSRAMEYLAMVGLLGFEDNAPNKLSGGQRRRVALARACVTKPDILICDDPTAGLDPVTSKRILNMIAGIRYQVENTVIVVSSDVLGILSVCDRIALMWEGKVIAEDTPSNFWESDLPRVKRFLDDAKLPFSVEQ